MLMNKTKYKTFMDIFERDNLVYGIFKKLRDVFRTVFDNESQETAMRKELEKNLKPNLIRIEK
ncbi:hypothetical protein B7P33_01865 [Sediminicola luteus]|uniref:Uncharacterized protein n=2 Tax=Flavobacteriaceae TaxID=49546 RepID=A0A2A4GE96_9FLAO|nr:hypothetical protein B7P33_01865 [Sediminicola luteus]